MNMARYNITYNLISLPINYSNWVTERHQNTIPSAPANSSMSHGWSINWNTFAIIPNCTWWWMQKLFLDFNWEKEIIAGWISYLFYVESANWTQVDVKLYDRSQTFGFWQLCTGWLPGEVTNANLRWENTLSQKSQRVISSRPGQNFNLITCKWMYGKTTKRSKLCFRFDPVMRVDTEVVERDNWLGRLPALAI